MQKVLFVTLAVVLASGCGASGRQQARRMLLQDYGGPGKSETNDNNFNLNSLRIHATSGFDQRPITIKFETGTDPKLKRAAKAAASTWNEAVGFTLIDFTGEVPSMPPVLYERLEDGINTFSVIRDWDALNIHHEVLGRTIWSNKTEDAAIDDPLAVNTDVIIGADILINGENYFLTDTTTVTEENYDPCLEYVDAESLFLHELGHLLGLAHTPFAEQSPMAPAMWIGPDQTNRTLTEMDRQRIRYIYVPGTPLPEEVEGSSEGYSVPVVITSGAPISDESETPVCAKTVVEN